MWSANQCRYSRGLRRMINTKSTKAHVVESCFRFFVNFVSFVVGLINHCAHSSKAAGSPRK